MNDDVQVEVADGVAVARLNRPERLNACRRATYEALHALFARLEREDAWGGLVLTGNGRAFCSGHDLDDVHGDERTVAETVVLLQDITRRALACSKPLVAAVNGPAVGFGVEVMLAFDLRIAAPGAYFMLPELSRGLFHTNGTYHLLPRLVGSGVAADMILTGRRVTADEALRSGLVSRVVAADELLPVAISTVAQLSRLPRPALAAAREGLRHIATGSLETALGFEAATCRRLWASAPHPALGERQ